MLDAQRSLGTGGKTMPNEGIEQETKRKTVTGILIRIDWSLWGALAILAIYSMIRMATERSGPEGRGLGGLAALLMILLLGGVAAAVRVAARKQSPTGLIVMALIMAWPLVFLIADPLVKANRERSYAAEKAKVGDFKDAALAAMARAIAQNDTATLTRLLNGQRPPANKDRAGNDLLAYSLVLVRERKGSAAPVRVLLDAGADPRQTRMGTGEDVVNYMIYGHSPDAHDAMRSLLQHGADPNVVHPQSGDTPLRAVYDDPDIVRALVDGGADIDRIQSDGTPAVVHFISTRQWESALYLNEKGAKLDVVNSHGLSVDYYLNEWKDNVYGDHPDGWDRVRAAIAERRAGHAR
jgi:hypothetical protein